MPSSNYGNTHDSNKQIISIMMQVCKFLPLSHLKGEGGGGVNHKLCQL